MIIMRVAIPIWEGRISPVFDTAERVAVSELEGGKVTSRSELTFDSDFLPSRAISLRRWGVQVLICGGISAYQARLVAAQGIKVISGMSGEIDEVLKAYSRGNILESRFSMPGWRGWKGRRYRGGR